MARPVDKLYHDSEDYSGPDNDQGLTQNELATATPATLATKNQSNDPLPCTVTDAAELWPDPLPLQNDEAPEPYPVKALPETIRNAVIEAQAFYWAPVPLVAASALSVVSLATQAYIDVARAAKENGKSKLTGPVSLNFLTVAKSGERKTTLDKHFMEVIRDHEEGLEKLAKPELTKWESRNANWEAAINGVKGRITALNKNPKSDPKEMDKAQNDLDELYKNKPQKPLEPRMMYSDFTPEILGFNLAKNYPTAAVISSEAGTVFGSHGMNKDSIMRNLSQFNQLWDGAPVNVDRKTSDSFKIRGARLTVSLQIQQEVLQEFYMRNGELARGSGFMARFLVAAPESTQGTRLYKDEPNSWPQLEKFNARLRTILSEPLPLTKENRLNPFVMRFSREANEIWIEFFNTIERSIGKGGKFQEVNDVASKAADNIARLAALFHYFDHDRTPICRDCMERAGAIVLWYLDEIKRFFGEIAMSPEQIKLKRLDDFLIKEAMKNGTTAVGWRFELQYGPIRKGNELEEALHSLEELDRIQIDRTGQRKIIKINPKLLYPQP